jgi:hypothetical protein
MLMSGSTVKLDTLYPTAMLPSLSCDSSHPPVIAVGSERALLVDGGFGAGIPKFIPPDAVAEFAATE